MVKRMVVALVVISGVLVGSFAAHAAPAARTSVTLSCSRGVSATAGVKLFPNADGTGSPAEVGVNDDSLACGGDGPNRERVVVSGIDAQSAEVTKFDVVTSDGLVPCGDLGAILPVPLKLGCPDGGRGARLVVR